MCSGGFTKRSGGVVSIVLKNDEYCSAYTRHVFIGCQFKSEGGEDALHKMLSLHVALGRSEVLQHVVLDSCIGFRLDG